MSKTCEFCEREIILGLTYIEGVFTFCCKECADDFKDKYKMTCFQGNWYSSRFDKKGE